MMDNRCGFHIKHINDVLQRDCNNSLKAVGLTMSQLTVLHQLERSTSGEMTLKELEKQLQVAQSTAAGIISRLEQKGFVEAGGSGTDKRIKIVRITSAGGACLAEAQVHAEDSEAHLLSALTEEEQSLFNCLLKKVSESL